MDWNEMAHLVQELRGSSSHVYKALNSLKKMTAQRDRIVEFVSLGGVECLVALLQKPSPKNIDLSISLLANCTREDEARVKVRNAGGLPVVVNVLKCIAVEETLCRGCRAVANLAEDPVCCTELHRLDGVEAVLSVLGKCEGTASKHMAVRALRRLSDGKAHSTRVVNLKGMAAVAKLLPSGRDELTREILRTIALFTSNSLQECIEQVQGTTCDILVSLTESSKSELVSMALACIVNLSNNSTIRPDLGNAIPALIHALRKHDGRNMTGFVSQVRALCAFSYESNNREKLLEHGGLILLVDILKDTGKKLLHEKIIHSLQNFLYHEPALIALRDAGLVPILVGLLKEYVEDNWHDHEIVVIHDVDESSQDMLWEASSESETEEHVKTPKTFRANSPSYREILWHKEETDNHTLMEISNLCTSQSPGSSPESIARWWSPARMQVSDSSPSSSAYSPERSPSSSWSPETNWSPIHPSSPATSVEFANLPDVDDRRYSPVFDDESETEQCDTLEHSLSVSEPPKKRAKVERSIPAYLSDGEAHRSGTRPREGLDLWIMRLLAHYAYMSEPGTDMLSEKTWRSLLDYVVNTRDPFLTKAEIVLTSLTRNFRCFIDFMRHNYPVTVFEKMCQMRHEKCSTCKDLKEFGEKRLLDFSVTAEGGYAFGEMKMMLMNSSRDVQMSVSIAIPFIIRKKNLLWKLMVAANGLDMLFEAMRDPDPCRDQIFASGLTRLAQSIGIEPPRISAEPDFHPPPSDKCLFLNLPSDVTFLLDDGTVLGVNRTMLEKKSDVFEAMFRGSFCESFQTQIRMPQVTHNALMYIVHYIYGCRTIKCHSLRIHNHMQVIELLRLSDQYLLSDLHEMLVKKMVQKFLNEAAFVDVFVSKVLHTANLVELLLQQFLCGSLTSKSKAAIIAGMREAECWEQFMEEVKGHLHSRLDYIRRGSNWDS